MKRSLVRGMFVVVVIACYAVLSSRNDSQIFAQEDVVVSSPNGEHQILIQQNDLNSSDLNRLISDAEQLTSSGVLQPDSGFDPFILEALQASNGWALANYASYPSDDTLPESVHLITPTLVLGIGKQSPDGKWKIALRTQHLFYRWLDDVPVTLLDDSAKEILHSLNPKMAPMAINAVQVPGLPYPVGHAWRFNNGPHDSWGTSSSLDFGTPTKDVSARVHAAETGVIINTPNDTCLGIQRGGDGLIIWYQHIERSDVDDFSYGQTISFGQSIGMTTMTPGAIDKCGGTTSGHHVHVTWQLQRGQYYNPEGSSFNGWVVVGRTLQKNGVIVEERKNQYVLHSGGCAAPNLRDPADGHIQRDGRTLTFRWDPVNNCSKSGYRFRVCSDSPVSNRFFCFIDQEVNGTETVITINDHDYMDLYWGVKAGTDQNEGNWSQRKFRIEPGQPPGDKWQAKYYDTIDKWNDDNNNGNYRCEKDISGTFLFKDYGTGAECGMDGDGWTGEYRRTVNLTGMYVFYAKHDDGFRMWLGNEKLFQRDSKGEGWLCPAVNLAGNYNFRVMLREDGGDANIDFKWSTDTSVCDPPTANFDVWPPSGPTPLAVSFHDTSQGPYSSCSWEYGDGSTGTTCGGPGSYHTHTYTNPGTYYPKLTITGPGGKSSKVLGNPITVSPNIPATPTMSAISNPNAASTFTASWSGSNGAISYELQQRLDSGQWTQVQSSSSTSKSVTVQANGYYCYRVNASNGGGVSSWSNEECTIVSAMFGVPTLDWINNLDYDATFTLSWSSVTGAVAYQIEEQRDSGGWIQIAQTNSMNFNKTNAQPGWLCYRVRGARNELRTEWSNEVCVIVLHPAPSLDTIANSDGDGNYTVSWGSVAGASDYVLEEKLNGGAWAEIYDGPNRSVARNGKSTGQWCYRVKAYYEDVNSFLGGLYSSEKCTGVNQSLNAPSIIAPSYGTTFIEGEAITLSWQSVATATGYYGEISGGPSPMTFGWQSSTSVNIGAQWPGYEYYWRVKARNSGGEGGYTDKWLFKVIPKAPSGLTAKPLTCATINLNWNDNSGSEDSLVVYRDSTEIKTFPNNTVGYTDYGLEENTTYTYKVRASKNGILSNESNTVSATTLKCPSQPPGVPTLKQPANNATLKRDGNLSFSWEAAQNANGYYVEFWGGPGIAINSGWQSATSWNVGEMWGGSYRWRVKARTIEGVESAWSETRSLFIEYGPPKALSSFVISAAHIRLSWEASADAPDNIDGYRLYRDGSAIATVNSSTVEYFDYGLNCGTTYRYLVRAYHGSDESDAANVITPTTYPCDIAPSTIDPINNADRDGNFEVSWSAAGTIESIYILEERHNTEAWREILRAPEYRMTRANRSGGQWCYRVKVLDGNASSSWSNVVCTQVQPVQGGSFRLFLPSITGP